jgi:hypothetical protein
MQMLQVELRRQITTPVHAIGSFLERLQVLQYTFVFTDVAFLITALHYHSTVQASSGVCLLFSLSLSLECVRVVTHAFS